MLRGSLASNSNSVRLLNYWPLPAQKHAGWSKTDLPVRQRTQTGIPIHRGKQGSREK